MRKKASSPYGRIKTALVMQFIYFANEVRDFGQIPKGEPKVPKREIELANSLMDKMSAEQFEPEKYHDEYRERFLEWWTKKLR